jgi:hypothetical protein
MKNQIKCMMIGIEIEEEFSWTRDWWGKKNCGAKVECGQLSGGGWRFCETDPI